MRKTICILMITFLVNMVSMAQSRQAMNEFYAHEWKTLKEFIRYSENNIPDTTIDVKFYYLDLSIAIDSPYIEGVVT